MHDENAAQVLAHSHKPAFRKGYPWYTNLGLLFIRSMVGVVFMFHGAQKLFGWFGGPGLEAFAEYLEGMNLPGTPQQMALLAACSEFFGGMMFLLGFGARLAAPFLVGTMLVASFMVHGKAFSLPDGMEYALALAFVSAGIGLTGPGDISLWRLFFRRSDATPSGAALEKP